jgi:hypothetical protein
MNKDIENELTTIVTADAAVNNVIKNRMYPLVVPPKKPRPFIAYARLRTERERTHGGYGKYTKVDIRLTCWSRSYDDAKALAKLVSAAIDNAGHETWGTLSIGHCFVIDEADELNPSPGLIELQLIGRNLDIEIAYEE